MQQVKGKNVSFRTGDQPPRRRAEVGVVSAIAMFHQLARKPVPALLASVHIRLRRYNIRMRTSILLLSNCLLFAILTVAQKDPPALPTVTAFECPQYPPRSLLRIACREW